MLSKKGSASRHDLDKSCYLSKTLCLRSTYVSQVASEHAWKVSARLARFARMLGASCLTQVLNPTGVRPSDVLSLSIPNL